VTVFGDDDPLDAWDPDDPIPDLIRNLIRRVERRDDLADRLLIDDLYWILVRVGVGVGGELEDD
jgi:hypothetical protein